VILKGCIWKHCPIWLIVGVTAKTAGIAARLLKKCELVDSVMLPFLQLNVIEISTGTAVE